MKNFWEIILIIVLVLVCGWARIGRGEVTVCGNRGYLEVKVDKKSVKVMFDKIVREEMRKGKSLAEAERVADMVMRKMGWYEDREGWHEVENPKRKRGVV